MSKRIKGQSVVEYVIILSAVVAAVVVFTQASFRKDGGSGLGKFMHQAASSITSESSAITANWR